MKEPITVLIQSNEQNSPRRANQLVKAIEKHEYFSFGGFEADLPVDVRFIWGDKRLSVELKETDDFVQSVLNGHLADQVTKLQTVGEPAFIVILGSWEDVEMSMGVVTKHGFRSKAEIARDYARCTSFAAAANACGYPVFAFDVQPMDILLSHAYHMINSTHNTLAYLNKEKSNVVGAAMLCMIPGIGPTIAEGLIEQYKSIDAIVGLDQEVLASTSINNRKIGKKAQNIWRALHGENKSTVRSNGGVSVEREAQAPGGHRHDSKKARPLGFTGNRRHKRG